MTDKFDEPPINPLEDTHPTQTNPQVLLKDRQQLSVWRQLIGLLSLIGAVGFTIGAIIVLLSPNDTISVPTTVPQNTQVAVQSPPLTSTSVSIDVQQNTPQAFAPTEVIATLDSQTIDDLLASPVQVVANINTVQIQARQFNPFTIIPDRPRNEVITYEAVTGDTITSIATRFGLTPETVAWSNDRRIVQVLRPGDIVNIPPIDGVLITAVGTTTIGEYASRYHIDDPYIVIDSAINPLLSGFTPESIPPSGAQIFFPGGTGEAITWTPTVIREGGGGSNLGGNFITFAPGDPGSCGLVENPGGGASWQSPIGPHLITRGYSIWHPGIDLAAVEGSPVYAANGGRVIFVGWNSFGYGNMIVIAHGPYTTLYGHLSNYIVGCGQDVVPGQPIGMVGSTGNSSGPHLHFELRYLDLEQDPAYTITFN